MADTPCGGPVRNSVVSETTEPRKGTVPFLLIQKSGQSPCGGPVRNCVLSETTELRKGTVPFLLIQKSGQSPSGGPVRNSVVSETTELRKGTVPFLLTQKSGQSPYGGLLVIGDPHLEGRQPGFRKDDYPTVILEKLDWCLRYAASNALLPVILGDLFDKPRDNPNWMVGRLIEMFSDEVLGLYGNHDVHYQPELSDDDSFSLLVKAKRIRLVSAEAPWRGTMGGRTVVIAGSSYRQPIPDRFSPAEAGGEEGRPLVIWLTHHDINVPGYDEGWITPHEIEGVDLVINGHIHRQLDNVQAGTTLWLTPGNISRRTRSDASRLHVPAVLRIDVTPAAFALLRVEVPHRPHDEVFHEAVAVGAREDEASAFVAGLAELQARRTVSGAGLIEFLRQNVNRFEPAVADEIMNLAREVNRDGET